MPWSCFNYPADVPPGTRDPNAVQPGLRFPPVCPVAASVIQLMSRLGDGVESDLGDPLKMPFMCFRY